jgi:DNA-binding GntR family transcriptional regulator
VSPREPKTLDGAAPSQRPRPPGARGGQRLSHAETVYDALKQAILSGDLAPGATLREEELARRYQVSRTPVREALSRLESEALAERYQGSGLVVSELGTDDIVDLYVLREALEGLAARLAASRRTEIDLARLEVLQGLSERGMQEHDLARVSQLNSEFHFLIWRIAGNRPLSRAINGVHQSVQRFHENTLGYPGRLEQSVREHAALLEAVRQRDHVAAEQIAVEHVRQVRNVRIALSLEHEALGAARGFVD